MELQQLDDKVDIKKSWFSEYSFHLVSNQEQFSKLVDMCVKRGLCSLDVETTGVDNRIYPDTHFNDGKKSKHGIRTIDKVVGLCISFDGKNGYYVPLNHEPSDSNNLPWDSTCDDLTRLCNGCRIIFHNSKFDQEMLYPMTGKEFWKINEYEDTMLMAGVLNPLKALPKGLKQLSKLQFGIDMIELNELFTEEQTKQLELNKQGKNFGILHPKEGLEYGCSDGIFTYKLFFSLKDKLRENDSSIYDLEKTFCNILRKMERNRVRLNIKLVEELNNECNKSMQNIGDSIRNFIESKTGNTGKWLSLNVGSGDQLRKAIFLDVDGLKLKPIPEMFDSESGSGSDDDDAAADVTFTLKDEALKALLKAYSKLVIKIDGTEKTIFGWVLDYRHYEKMEGSFTSKFIQSHDKYGEVRPDYKQIGTDTARLSSKAGEIKHGYSGVNFQGMPRDSDDDKPETFKRLRECIIPRDDYVLVKIDYAGEELRVVTNLSGDPIWTKSFLHEDGDVHSITTKILYGKQNITKDERNRGKRCNFAVIYGGGAGAISRNIGCSIEDGGRMLDNLRSGVPILMGYSDQQRRFAKQNKCIYTAFGRRIPIPTIDHQVVAIRRKAERCAINYTIQSTSADVLKLAMCFVDKNIRKRGWEDKLKYVMTVHDEVVYEIKPEILQEAIPLLNEWMVLPWKLPKAHGKAWVVPLETEPDIDLSWRAKYNFFKMVDGIKPKPSDVDKNGNFVGDLKKNEYFHNGKIYQSIPDFLKPWIKRTDQLDDNDVDNDEIKLDTKLKEDDEVKSDIVVVSNEETVSVDATLSDVEVHDNVASVSPIKDLAGLSTNTEQKEQVEPKKESNGHILNWIIKSPLNHMNVKKLQAICLLTDGETPLRISLPNGVIVVDDSKGIKVKEDEFVILTRLFGLG